MEASVRAPSAESFERREGLGRTLAVLVERWSDQGAAPPVAAVLSIFDDLLETFHPESVHSDSTIALRDVRIDHRGVARISSGPSSVPALSRLLREALGGDHAVPPAVFGVLSTAESHDPPVEAEWFRAQLRQTLGPPATHSEVAALFDAIERDVDAELLPESALLDDAELAHPTLIESAGSVKEQVTDIHVAEHVPSEVPTERPQAAEPGSWGQEVPSDIDATEVSAFEMPEASPSTSDGPRDAVLAPEPDSGRVVVSPRDPSTPPVEPSDLSSDAAPEPELQADAPDAEATVEELEPETEDLGHADAEVHASELEDPSDPSELPSDTSEEASASEEQREGRPVVRHGPPRPPSVSLPTAPMARVRTSQQPADDLASIRVPGYDLGRIVAFAIFALIVGAVAAWAFGVLPAG